MKDKIFEIEHIIICLKEHIALSDDEDNLLLDYITNLQNENIGLKVENETLRSDFKNQVELATNLQQENERLKDNLETMTFTAKVKQEAVDSLISRIDKAVEYITTEQLYTNYQWDKSQYIKILKDLLTILQGESHEE